jgi:hypothetical protein
MHQPGVVFGALTQGDGTLHVHTATAGAISANAAADDLVVEPIRSSGPWPSARSPMCWGPRWSGTSPMP